MAEDSQRDWFSDLETDAHLNYWLDNSFDEDQSLEDILQQPQDHTAPLETPTTVNNSVFEQTNQQLSSSNSSFISQDACKKPHASPKTIELSYENSTASLLPTILDPWKVAYRSQSGSQGTDSLPMSSSRASPQTNKIRGTSETTYHKMSERKRRQDLRTKFITLSASIPGLKKMDKVHILGEAVNYVKQLQKRVKELEEDIKKNCGETGISISRSHLYIDDSTTLCEAHSSGCYRPNETLPDVKACVLGKDVLVKIHCGKQNGFPLNILSQLESLHLKIVSSHVLPFGNTFDITIIAQMGDKYSMVVKDLVKNLRLAMLKACDEQRNAC